MSGDAGAAAPHVLAAGNQALQRLARGPTAEEHQADEHARAVTPGRAPAAGGAAPGSCGCGAGTGGCGCGSGARHGSRPPAGLSGAGAALPPAVQARFARQLGAGVADARVHTGRSAARLTEALGARAVTRGRDIAFAPGAYRPGTAAGDELLTHELTHVEQQRAGPPRVRRFVDGDVRQQSITPAWADALTDGELEEQVALLREHIVEIGPSATDADSMRANLAVLEEEVRERTRAGRTVAGTTGETVPRPPGLPLEDGYYLEPIELPAEMVADLPEGQVVDLPVAAATQALGGGAAGTLLVTGQQLRTYGFASAQQISRFSAGAQGANAIGVVSFPRWTAGGAVTQGWQPGSSRPFGLQTRLPWGHTAIFSRVNGRITIIRSFAPQSLIGTGIQNMASGGAVMSGQGTVPGAWYHGGATPGRGIPMFTNTLARTIEYPVTADVAEAFAQNLPEVGPTGVRYTGGPQLMQGQNCISCAVDLAEDVLGGPVGPRVGPAGAPESVVNLGRSGEVVPRGASQGQMYRWMTQVEQGVAEAAPVPNAGAPTVSSMSTGMRVLRWGGRVFFVVGVATVPLEVAMAPEEERERTFVGATAGFAGGFAAGAAAGLVCGPGAPVCSILLGIGFGVAGGMASRAVAESVYDAATGRTQGGGSGSTPCPSCHAMQRDWERDRMSGLASDWALPGPDPGTSLLGPDAFGAPRRDALSSDEIDLVIEYLQSMEDDTER